MGSQVECVDRFLSWFAFHLSSYNALFSPNEIHYTNALLEIYYTVML